MCRIERTVHRSECVGERSTQHAAADPVVCGWRPREGRWVLGGLLVIVMLATSPPTMAGDPVAAFLERHGLTEVLATHLEQRLERADDDERETLVLRLADLYAELLDAETDSVKRTMIERRSRQLLDLAPDDRADELRLALARNTYRSAERAAENHRLRLADAESVDRAESQFAEIVPELRDLSQHLDRRVSTLERRLTRAGRSEADAIEDRLTRLRRTLMQSRYMHAWSLYYQAFLSNDAQEAERRARHAQRIFADLLMTESAHPRPEEVSVDLRSIEPLARSIVGMALCHSMTSSWATAENWIDLLTHENAAPQVKPLVEGWRVLILLEHEMYQQAEATLRRVMETNESIPISWLRLAAVSAMEADEWHAEAHELARFALTQLAARDELQQVFDLAERYGTDALGDGGFAMRYIEGLVAYRQARQRHDEDAPASKPELRDEYEQARAFFDRALQEDDAADYPEAADSARLLVAWSLFYADDLPGAAEQFELASELADGELAEEALWMAIVVLDRLLAREEDTELRRRHRVLSDRFLSAYPDSPHAPTLRVNRSMQADRLTQRELEQLLAVSPRHEAYFPARRRAIHALYRDFRRADDADRRDQAYRFLSVALPLIDQPETFGAADDPQRLERQVTVIRQVLEVSLHQDVQRAEGARAAIVAYEALSADHEDAVPHVDEIRFRRVQLALLEGDRAEAERVADALWMEDHRSRFAKLAERAMFMHARRWWQSTTADASDYEAALNTVIQHGGRVLREFEDEPDPLAAPGAVDVARSVAEASIISWQRTGDVERGRVALFLSRRLLEHQPNHRDLLHDVALLADAFGRQRESLNAWRRLVAGSERGSKSWLEARYHQIRLLAELDPARASRLMRQHLQLYPDGGDEPWGEKFQSLAEELQIVSDQPMNEDEDERE